MVLSSTVTWYNLSRVQEPTFCFLRRSTRLYIPPLYIRERSDIVPNFALSGSSPRLEDVCDSQLTFTDHDQSFSLLFVTALVLMGVSYTLPTEGYHYRKGYVRLLLKWTDLPMLVERVCVCVCVCTRLGVCLDHCLKEEASLQIRVRFDKTQPKAKFTWLTCP